jgi:hypothetical protein
MKKTVIIIVFILFCLVHTGFTANEMQPKVSVDNLVFTFKPVPEGAHISHEFIVKNTGDATLHIINVSPP